MKITIDCNIKPLQDQLTAIAQRKLPGAMRRTVNDLAFQVRQDVYNEMKMPSVFDQPVKPFTLRSMEIIKTQDKVNPSAWVGLRLDAVYERALAHEFTGGNRRWKRMEGAFLAKGIMPKGTLAIPGNHLTKGVELDAYGNIKPSLVVRLISYFGAFGESGYRANMLEKTKKRLAKRGKTQEGWVIINGVEYFLSTGKGLNRHLLPGIWAKTGIHGFKVKAILLFLPKKKAYRRRIELDRNLWRG